MAACLADRLRDLVSKTGRAKLAVPGGTTPGPMLARLGRTDLPWPEVVVTLTDERCVPATSKRSNQRLLRETLFNGPAASAVFVPLYGGAAEPGSGLDAINAGLEQTALPLDIAVLGMGADMHTASLFPGAIGLEHALQGERSAVLIKAPGADEPRITLSAPVLKVAERHLLITGVEKRRALDRARDLADPVTAPVSAVLDNATVHYAD